MKSFEKSNRSLAKTVTYRVLIIISTFIMTYLITGEVKLTFEITIVINVVNTLLYYVHERVWNVIGWGKTK